MNLVIDDWVKVETTDKYLLLNIQILTICTVIYDDFTKSIDIYIKKNISKSCFNIYAFFTIYIPSTHMM